MLLLYPWCQKPLARGEISKVLYEERHLPSLNFCIMSDLGVGLLGFLVLPKNLTKRSWKSGENLRSSFPGNFWLWRGTLATRGICFFLLSGVFRVRNMWKVLQTQQGNLTTLEGIFRSDCLQGINALLASMGPDQKLLCLTIWYSFGYIINVAFS